MGRASEGILGGFNGTDDTVAGSRWRGIPVIKRRPIFAKNRTFTPAQLTQQATFALANKAFKRFTQMLRNTYESVAGQMSRSTCSSLSPGIDKNRWCIALPEGLPELFSNARNGVTWTLIVTDLNSSDGEIMLNPGNQGIVTNTSMNERSNGRQRNTRHFDLLFFIIGPRKYQPVA